MRPLPQVIDDALEAQAARQRDWLWLVSDHAAERYRDRVDRSLTPIVAKRLIGALLRDAELLPTTTFLGQQRWLLPGKDAVVVCRPDPKMKARVAVTVLGPHEMYEQDAIEEVREAFERVAPSLSPTPKPAVVETSAPEPMPAPPAPREGLVIVRRASPSTLSGAPRSEPAPSAKPAAKAVRFDPWEQAYRALEKRHEALKAHLDRQQAVASANAARRDPVIVMLRQQLQENQEANRRWKERAHAAEAKLLGAMAEPIVEAPALATAGSVSAERLQRAAAHALHAEEEAQRWRRLMRVAVLALRSGDCAAGLAALEAARPGITGDHFCYPERFTKAERKAATMAAEAAAAAGTPAAPPPPAEGPTP